jgi:aryl-alcohol dehydrogenase-like predicted oxidoreductase
MGFFGVGATPSSTRLEPSTDAPATPTAVTTLHRTSAPIPVQGTPLGAAMRVPLGETGARVFPLILGGAEFGWHVDLTAAHAILDAYRERGGNAVQASDAMPRGAASTSSASGWRVARARLHVLCVRVGTNPDHPGLGSVNLIRAVEASLTRLQTDRIDVLYLDATAEDQTPSKTPWPRRSG